MGHPSFVREPGAIILFLSQKTYLFLSQKTYLRG
jgi:hypothetical protein